MPHPRISILVLAAAALTGAPVHAQPDDHSCKAVEQEPPRRRRPAEAARDSLQSAIRDTLRGELVQAARDAGVAQPAGIVFVERVNRRTGEARVWTHRANAPESVFSPAVARRADLLVRWPHREPLLNFRLDALALPETPAVECLPVLLNREQFSRDLQGLAARLASQGTYVNPRLSVYVKMLVTRDGDVAYAILSRRSANAEVNRAVAALAEGLRFRPGRVDQVPVDVWVQQPVIVMLPEPPPERPRPE